MIGHLDTTMADQARSLVERSTALQGLPEVVTDPETLQRVAALLQSSRGNAGPKAGATLASTIAATSPQGGRHVHGT